MIRQAVHLDKIRRSKFGKWNVNMNEINMYMPFLICDIYDQDYQFI